MKSTLAFQFSSIFQSLYPNALVVFIDIETAANRTNKESGSRIDAFNLDRKRFQYEPLLVDITQIFTLIESLSQIKQAAEKKVQKEFKVMIIWDSIASTPSSKTEGAEDPNKIIGVKARQLTFCLEKYASVLAFHRITFLAIDQVRANLVIDPYAQKEKTVGVFKDFRAATSIAALNHKVSQWLFLSRKKTITPDDGIGVNGWYMSLYTEKNKNNVPSNESIMCVFDKRSGLHPFWSEYTFLSELTPSEHKYYKTEDKLLYPLSIIKNGPQVSLKFIDPTTGSVQYESEKFYRKNAYDLYKSSEAFKQAFDYTTSIAVDYRIKQGLFQMKNELKLVERSDDSDVNINNDVVENLFTDTSVVEESPIVDEKVIEEETYQSIF